jgi:hypothetical protein
MFEFDEITCKLSSVNARAEKHGEERHPAFDLKIEAMVSSDYLIHFDPELRQMLYKQTDNPDLIERIGNEAPLTKLRFPKMSAINWDWECPGYHMKFHYGVSGAGDIELEDVKLDKFSFDCQEGGAVGLTFRAICHPESNDVGRLCEFIQEKVQISLVSPETLAASEAQQAINIAKD